MTLTSLDKAARYTFKIDDVVYSMNGHPTFYRVIKRTKCMVTLMKLQSEVVEDDGYGQNGLEVPVSIPQSEDPRYAEYVKHNPDHFFSRTKIKLDEEGNEYARIDGKWFQTVRPYQGRPLHFSTY